jgi:hypothetical protein
VSGMLAAMQDMDLLYGIPPEKLLEVGLAFSL